MILSNNMEKVLLVITTILCTLLFYNLRSALRWRVNCWFCNSNFWIKFLDRNSWTCPKCEQYNGFTKDGDYNKPLITTKDQPKVPNVFKKSPPKNGLCKMCNINQQLKVTQLANFVPMNEDNFDHEIDLFKAQLDKAYKLCSPCKKVLQIKLHKEKKYMLDSKLLQNRTPRKGNNRKEKQNEFIQKTINKISKIIASLLILLVAIELYKNMKLHKNIYRTITHYNNILYNLIERVYSIVKMKVIMTFPILENYSFNGNDTLDVDFTALISDYNDLTQKALGGLGCVLQIMGHVWSINNMHSVLIDLLWTVFVATSLYNHFLVGNILLINSIKLFAVVAVFLIYGSIKVSKPVPKMTPKKLKNMSNGSTKMNDSQDISFDTDDDVSLSKFGVHNLSSSSKETLSPLNNSFVNGRSFTPRTDSLWSKPKHNSTFSINSVSAKSPSLLSETVFVKPAFNKYQNLIKDESDSDLDESISSLCISSPKKNTAKTNPVFALRKFTASPNFVTPMPINHNRPLISPSKLGYSTSWVAGGYWGSDGERNLFNINGSRSSSQSSGFESQTSGLTQRNVFSHPPSREESICGETDRASVLLDKFQNCNMNHQSSQNFAPLSSPVFPQMQYNNHVRIPQPRFAQGFSNANSFNSEHNFKAPGGSGLIKLPQVNSFSH